MSNYSDNYKYREMRQVNKQKGKEILVGIDNLKSVDNLENVVNLKSMENEIYPTESNKMEIKNRIDGLIIDDNTVYEIDEDCYEKARKKRAIQNVNRMRDKK